MINSLHKLCSGTRYAIACHQQLRVEICTQCAYETLLTVGAFVNCYVNCCSYWKTSTSEYLTMRQIAADFATLYPGAADKMAAVWPHMYGTVLKRVRTAKIKDKHLMQMMTVVREDVENPKSEGRFKNITKLVRNLLNIARVTAKFIIIHQIMHCKHSVHFIGGLFESCAAVHYWHCCMHYSFRLILLRLHFRRI